MDFIHEVRAHSARFKTRIEHLDTEEATKTALVMPFVRMMGYDTEDPTEVVPEFTADVGTKKGEKVDYALRQEGKPIVLIEAKKHGAPLRVEQESQLFRYFQATAARFAILTDGIVYKFYSDIDEFRLMDSRPFFEFNMLDFTDHQVEQLKRFTKEAFDLDKSVEAARELKHLTEIKRVLAEELANPTYDFLFAISKRAFAKLPTPERRKKVVAPLIRQAATQLINERISERLKTALVEVDQANQAAESERVKDKPVEIGELLLESRGAEARGSWNEDDNSIAVRAGATVAKQPAQSLSGGYAKLREAMLEDGLLVDEGHVYRLTQDMTFTSPSAAASVIAGMDHDGPYVWKDTEGRRLRHLLAGQRDGQ